MRKIETISYKGKNILYLNFSGLKKLDDIQPLINEVKGHMIKQPLKSQYALTNIEEMHFDKDIRDAFTDLVKHNKPYMLSSAIVGVTGMKQIVFNAIMKITGRDIKSFNTVEEAKEWLAAKG